MWNLALTSNFIFKEFDKFRCARFDLFYSRNNLIIRLPLRYGKRRTTLYLDLFLNVYSIGDFHRKLRAVQKGLIGMHSAEIYFFASNYWSGIVMEKGGKCFVNVETYLAKLTAKCKCSHCDRFFASGAALSSYGVLSNCCRHFLARFDERDGKYIRQIKITPR